MTIYDIIWGRVEIEPEYIPIIRSKEFQDMKNKSQLGLNANPNATHTRYQHCIGDYVVSGKLVDLCRKFFKKIVINEKLVQAIKCMTLVHDLGHACFSHSSEHYLEGTHEENTVRILKDPNSEIHKAIIDSLGADILEMVIDLIELKAKIKGKVTLDNEHNLIFIIAKLLSGGIDTDRIDYIARDSKYLTGENNDFSDIFEGMDLAYIGDNLEVVFDERQEYRIVSFFNKRFELYDCDYFGPFTKILEAIYGDFLKKAGVELTWDTSEVEMKENFRRNLTNPDEVIKRFAYLLHYRINDGSIILNELDSAEKLDFLIKRIYNAVPELTKYPECIHTAHSAISVYSKKNKIYIKKGGQIQDISDCTEILKSDLTKDKYAFGLDMELLRRLLKRDQVPETQIDDIIRRTKKVTSNGIEQGKIYNFLGNNDPREDFKILRDDLGLTNPTFIKNHDTYYQDPEGILKANEITVCYRVSDNNESEWTVKRPVKDQTSTSKRDKQSFTSLDEVLGFLKIECGITISGLEEECTLTTLRAKYQLKYLDSEFEVVFDKTLPICGDNTYVPSYMVKCELKTGESSNLYFMSEDMKKFSFLGECNLSKREIAMATVATTSPVNNPNQNDMSEFRSKL